MLNGVALGNGGNLEVGVEIVGDGLADHGLSDHFVSDETDGVLSAVDDDEKMTVGAEEGSEGHL